MAVTYEPIASQTLGSATATVTFSNIPGTYTDLILVSQTQRASGANYMTMVFNGDTTSGLYSTTELYGTGTTAGSYRESNKFYMLAGDGSSSYQVIMQHHIMSYANTNVFKTMLGAGGSTSNIVDRYVNLWRSTSAITSLSLSYISGANFISGCTFSLYGVKAA